MSSSVCNFSECFYNKGGPEFYNRTSDFPRRKTSDDLTIASSSSLSWQMYVTCTVQAKGTRLAKPVLSLGLMCLAFLTGLNRVAEYRNHWSDVIAGFIIGTAIATFLVRLTHKGHMCCCMFVYDRGM